MFAISGLTDLGSSEIVPRQQSSISTVEREDKVLSRKIKRPTEYNYPQKCEFCGQVFLEKDMVRHKKAHPESYTLDCMPCKKSFHSKAAYDMHYNIHKVYHCLQCKKDFNARKHFRSHMERIHKVEGERPRLHQCEHCHKSFKDKFVLNSHLKTHSGEKKHKCSLCSYASNNMTYMKQHVLNHTNQLCFKCPFCYRGFETDDSLQAHILRLHANEPKMYKCNICGKLSTSKGNLRQHQRTHNSNQKNNYKCNECGKTFALQCRLRKHLLSHKGQDKIHCTICSKLLSKDSYKKHLKVHSGEKPFLCDYCGESFATNSCLTAHRKTHVGDKLNKSDCLPCHDIMCGPVVDVLEMPKKQPTFDQSMINQRNNYHPSDRPFLFISYTSQQ